MVYSVPVIVSILIYWYTRRKVNGIKNRITSIKRTVMNEQDKWLISKFEVLHTRISHIEKQITKLETKVSVYSALAVFISTLAVKLLDNII